MVDVRLANRIPVRGHVVVGGTVRRKQVQRGARQGLLRRRACLQAASEIEEIVRTGMACGEEDRGNEKRAGRNESQHFVLM